MRVLLTRLAGKRVALGQVDSGFGPTLWIGEFRDEHGHAVALHEHRGERYLPLVISATSLGGVLTGLQEYAKDRTFRR